MKSKSAIKGPPTMIYVVHLSIALGALLQRFWLD